MDVTRSGPTSVNVSGNVARSTPPTVRPKLSKRTTSYEIVGDLEEHRLGSWLIGRTIDRRRAVSLALDAHYTRNTLHHSDGTEGVVLRPLDVQVNRTTAKLPLWWRLPGLCHKPISLKLDRPNGVTLSDYRARRHRPGASVSSLQECPAAGLEQFDAPYKSSEYIGDMLDRRGKKDQMLWLRTMVQSGSVPEDGIQIPVNRESVTSAEVKTTKPRR